MALSLDGTTGISATGNITGGNLLTPGLISATGNITGGNLVTGGIVSATGNVNAGNVVLSNAAIISANNMQITTGANTNLGNITGNWTLTTGSRLQATYADLAEYYEADMLYEPGTVLEFGGEKEVTACKLGCRAIGVISENPAFMMNKDLVGGTYVALKGRVPVKVVGIVNKGDRLTSGDNGVARVPTVEFSDVFAIALVSSSDIDVKLIEAVIL